MSTTESLVFAMDRPALDASNYREVERELRAWTPFDAPLVIDWSGVVYVDFLGMEMVFDAVMERKAAIIFVGLSRDLSHLLLRMQLLPVVPSATDVDAGRRMLGSAS